MQHYTMALISGDGRIYQFIKDQDAPLESLSLAQADGSCLELVAVEIDNSSLPQEYWEDEVLLHDYRYQNGNFILDPSLRAARLAGMEQMREQAEQSRRAAEEYASVSQALNILLGVEE